MIKTLNFFKCSLYWSLYWLAFYVCFAEAATLVRPCPTAPWHPPGGGRGVPHSPLAPPGWRLGYGFAVSSSILHCTVMAPQVFFCFVCFGVICWGSPKNHKLIKELYSFGIARLWSTVAFLFLRLFFGLHVIHIGFVC